MAPHSQEPRVGLFLDAAFRVGRVGDRQVVLCGDELLGFATFAAAVGDRLGGLTLIARRTDDCDRARHSLRGDVGLAPLPDYPSLRDLRAVVAAFPGIVAGLWRGLADVDVAWVSASHPFGLMLAAFALLRGRGVALLVRQDSMRYFRARLPGWRWKPVLALLGLVDGIYHLLGRVLPTAVVGEEIACQYGAPRENLLSFYVNLTPSEGMPTAPVERPWRAPVRLLTIGRLEPEKDPMLLVETLAKLEELEPGRFTGTWVGSGRMAGVVASRAKELGMADRLELPGFVAAGSGLERYFDDADCFVHVSVTEGVPGVITEAMSHGLPVVATDVGGVPEATGHGEAALLVPPGDRDALVAAVRHLSDEPGLRSGLADRALELGRQTAIDVQSQRVADFLRERC